MSRLLLGCRFAGLRGCKRIDARIRPQDGEIATPCTPFSDDRIDRRVKTGALDKGDIAGIRHMGRRIVLELKDYGGKYLPGPWLAEAKTERVNDQALAGFVVAKRRGITDPSKQLVIGTVADLTALLTGLRPDEGTTP